MIAYITVIDIDATELATLRTEGDSLGEILDTVDVLIGHISNLPETYDIYIEIGE